MSLVEHLVATRTKIEMAKELASEAKKNADLQRRVHELEVQQFWLTKPPETAMHGSAGAYHNGSDERRKQIDDAIKAVDALFGRERATRDRRKSDSDFEGYERRQNDRRSLFRSDNNRRDK